MSLTLFTSSRSPTTTAMSRTRRPAGRLRRGVGHGLLQLDVGDPGADHLPPPSAAKDPVTYREFVTRLVEHCAGRVHYWQCDNEPCNVGLTRAGSAAEYVIQLRSFYEAVKGLDSSAAVVLGGAPFGLPAAGPESAERYQQAERIPADVEIVRRCMRDLGYERPIVAGEYNAPWPSLYPGAESAMNEAMAAAFASPGEGEEGATPEAGAARRTPEQLALAAPYERMAGLPPQLQMFMHGCPPELESPCRRHLRAPERAARRRRERGAKDRPGQGEPVRVRSPAARARATRRLGTARFLHR